MKNSNDTIGIQTRDLPACSAVPPVTAPPRASSFLISGIKLHHSNAIFRFLPIASRLATLPGVSFQLSTHRQTTECQTIHEYAFNIQLQSRIDIHSRNIHMTEHIRNTYYHSNPRAVTLR